MIQKIMKYFKIELLQAKEFKPGDECPICKKDPLAMSLLGGYLFCLNPDCNFMPNGKEKQNRPICIENYISTQKISGSIADDDTVMMIRRRMYEMSK